MPMRDSPISFDVPPALAGTQSPRNGSGVGPKKGLPGTAALPRCYRRFGGWGNQQQVIKLGQSPDVPSSKFKSGPRQRRNVLRWVVLSAKTPSPNPAPSTARIIHVAGNLLQALGCKFIEPINELCITATLLDETVQLITAIAPALLTGYSQHIELADEIAEDDCAVAGHAHRRQG